MVGESGLTSEWGDFPSESPIKVRREDFGLSVDLISSRGAFIERSNPMSSEMSS